MSTKAERFGVFLNPRGYTLVKVGDKKGLLFRTALYEFTLNSLTPLTFKCPDGAMIQPDRHLAETDLGSPGPKHLVLG